MSKKWSFVAVPNSLEVHLPANPIPKDAEDLLREAALALSLAASGPININGRWEVFEDLAARIERFLQEGKE